MIWPLPVLPLERNPPPEQELSRSGSPVGGEATAGARVTARAGTSTGEGAAEVA